MFVLSTPYKQQGAITKIDYNVTFTDKRPTLEKFISHVLTGHSDEYGKITVEYIGSRYTIKYSHGRVLYDSTLDRMKTKRILYASACGFDGCKDYILGLSFMVERDGDRGTYAPLPPLHDARTF